MHRTRYWALLGVVFVAALVVALSTLEAQRPAGESSAQRGQVGRYQAVKVDGDTIILLDTSTGDLYRAGHDDIKPYSQRRSDRRGAPVTRPVRPPAYVPPTTAAPPQTAKAPPADVKEAPRDKDERKKD
jgi:hypothetical protein